jgi:hypothetical protein
VNRKASREASGALVEQLGDVTSFVLGPQEFAKQQVGSARILTRFFCELELVLTRVGHADAP